jgi:hypothetical protein
VTRAEIELLADLVAARVAERLRTIVGPPHVPGALQESECPDTQKETELMDHTDTDPDDPLSDSIERGRRLRASIAERTTKPGRAATSPTTTARSRRTGAR